MQLISKLQKEALLEEAAKTALKDLRIASVAQIYKDLLGTHDFLTTSGPRLGQPLAPMYKAVEGRPIEVDRIRSYFKRFASDLRVEDEALERLEDDVVRFAAEVWTTVQALRHKSDDIIAAANVDQFRLQGKPSWTFTETFTNVFYTDTVSSTVWFDTSEGVVFLPFDTDDQTVKRAEFDIVEASTNDPGGFLSSTPEMAFDGLQNTNWRAQVTQAGTIVSLVLEMLRPTDLMGLTLDPIGYGQNVLIQIDTGDGYQTIRRVPIYRKTTVPMEVTGVRRLRLELETLDTVLPRTIGLREVVLLKGAWPAKSARFVSLPQTPSFNFNEIKLDLDAEVPAGTYVRPFYSFDGSTWFPLQTGVWKATSASQGQAVEIDFSDLDPYGALWQSAQFSLLSVTPLEGQLDVGASQFEVAARRRVFLEDGDLVHNPGPFDFNTNLGLKAWVDPLTELEVLSIDADIDWQLFDDANANHPELRRGRAIVGQLWTTQTDYPALTWLPLCGPATGWSMVRNHVYRFRVNLFADDTTFFDGGLYWFLQGFREAGERTFAQIGRSYGAFALYVNGVKVAGSDQPRTLFDDNTSEPGAPNGESYTLALNKGWNVWEMYLYVPELPDFTTDPQSSANPFLQLTVYPSPFDSVWQRTYGVSKVLGSGEFEPVSEFDLLWHVPKDPTYWAWPSVDTKKSILFNTDLVRPIDGFLGRDEPARTYPGMKLRYKGFTDNGLDGQNSATQVYVRLDLGRDDSTRATPLVRGYTVSVR